MKRIIFLLTFLVSVSYLRLGAEDLCCAECCICPSNNTGYWNIGVDWLYWKVRQSNMDIGGLVHATTNTFDPDIDWDPIFDGTDLSFPFNSSNGVRVYANYDFCPCDWIWTLSAVYTYIPTSTSVAHSQAPGLNTPFDSTFVSLASNRFTFLTILPSTNVTNASAKWCAQVHYFDLDMARNIAFDCRFQLNPHFGLRVLHIYQRYTMAGNDETTVTTFTGKIQQCLTGVGLEGGLCGLYLLPCNFFIKGQIGAALMYSNFNTKIRFDSRHPITGGTAFENGILNSKANTWEPVYDVDFSVALGYETCLGGFSTDIEIGWEQHKLFNTNQFTFPTGDLYMQGLTLGLSMYF